MDGSGAVATISSSTQAGLQYAVQISVLRKVLDAEAQSGRQIVQAIQQALPAANPPHLGQTVDTAA
jgi:hypothetical protein